MGNFVKHLSVRLTWHDNGWDGKSCLDPKNNLSCQQDSNVFIHEAKVLESNRCKTDRKKALTSINRYLNQNECFLEHSKLGIFCKKHNSDLLNQEKEIIDIPPCDTFAAFAPENPYVHTKNPARKMDQYDEEALKRCKGSKKPWEFIKNWKQVRYFPQDYRKYIREGQSVALFYTVNFPEETGKFIMGYSVIKDKNDDFLTVGKGSTSIPNKSNAGSRWGEEWCFLLDEEDRFRFSFQELIRVKGYDLLEKVKAVLKVEPQDEIYFRNLSLFIPDYILVKYLKKLKQAVEILILHKFGNLNYLSQGLQKIDRKLQELSGTFQSFKYPGLPAVGRLLGWWNAFSDYEEYIEQEEILKELFFKAIKNNRYSFSLGRKTFYVGSKRQNKYPAKGFSKDFLNLLEEIFIYYPIGDEKVLEQIWTLINKDILSADEIRKNPYVVFEKFVPTPDGSVNLSFEDIDYGEFNRKGKENLKNPYRIRALIHEYFKVYRDDPGFVWVSFKDIESYIRRRLASGLGFPAEEYNFEKILNREEIRETVNIDWKRRYLSLKELVYYENSVREKIEELLRKDPNKVEVNTERIVEAVKNRLKRISKDEVTEKVNALRKLLRNRFTFVSGVAGAGKSTLVKILVDLLEDLGEDVKILAPTGKASERLREEGLEAETIHYFLKENGFIDNDLFTFTENGEKQEIENLIIDEISMVPLDLLHYLLSAVELGKIKRLIFVGDIKQLPPIGYGYPAKDIYQYLDKCYSRNLVRLEKSYRSSDKFIEIANKLREKNLERNDIEPFLTEEINNSNFQILEFKGQEQLEELITKILEKEGITKDKLAENPEYFQILAPKKEGYAGTKHLNRFVLDKLNGESFSWNGTKVIKLINTYCRDTDKRCTETFNGMIGVIKVTENGKKVIEFSEEKEIPFSPDRLGYEYDYAYAITVHKSQGSEFDIVVAILPKNIGGLFTRELLYTVLTRARKKLYLLVEDVNMLFETPPELIRSENLFGPNFVELPEDATYISPNGTKVFKKLDLYIASILDLFGKKYLYKTPEADFYVKGNHLKVHLVDLNTFEGRLRDENLKEDSENIKIRIKDKVDLKPLVEKLGLKFPGKQNKTDFDYRETLRQKILSEEGIYIEPHTNLKVITHNGLVTGSLSEAILMLFFDKFEIPYEYEKKITLKGKGLLPDFYLPDKDIFWEHLGLLDDPFYLQSWKEKKKLYEESGFKAVPFKEWNGETGCCIFTTEEDIKDLKLLKELFEKKKFLFKDI